MVMGSVVSEGANSGKKPSAKRRPPQVPETAPSRNLRPRSQPNSMQPPPTANPLPTAPIKTSPPLAILPKQATKKAVKKPASQLYRLTKSEVPNDVGGLEVSQYIRPGYGH